MEHKDSLEAEGFFLTQGGLDECLESADSKSMSDVRTYILNSDLKHLGASKLPKGSDRSAHTTVAGPLVVQLKAVKNVAVPDEKQDYGGARMLLLTLTDGHASVRGLEYQQISGISGNTPPGTKVCLRNVPVNNGFLLLDSNNCRVLGGDVPSLRAGWRVEQKRIQSADGPPPFTAVPLDSAKKSEAVPRSVTKREEQSGRTKAEPGGKQEPTPPQQRPERARQPAPQPQVVSTDIPQQQPLEQRRPRPQPQQRQRQPQSQPQRGSPAQQQPHPQQALPPPKEASIQEQPPRQTQQQAQPQKPQQSATKAQPSRRDEPVAGRDDLRQRSSQEMMKKMKKGGQTRYEPKSRDTAATESERPVGSESTGTAPTLLASIAGDTAAAPTSLPLAAAPPPARGGRGSRGEKAGASEGPNHRGKRGQQQQQQRQQQSTRQPSPPPKPQTTQQPPEAHQHRRQQRPQESSQPQPPPQTRQEEEGPPPKEEPKRAVGPDARREKGDGQGKARRDSSGTRQPQPAAQPPRQQTATVPGTQSSSVLRYFPDFTAYPAQARCEGTISGLNLVPPQPHVEGSDWQLQIALLDTYGVSLIAVVSEFLFPSFLGLEKAQLYQLSATTQGQAYLQQQIAAHYPRFHQQKADFELHFLGPMQYGGPAYVMGYELLPSSSSSSPFPQQSQQPPIDQASSTRGGGRGGGRGRYHGGRDSRGSGGSTTAAGGERERGGRGRWVARGRGGGE